MFPETCNRGVISYLEGERVPKNCSVGTERIRKVFIYEIYGQKWGMKELEFGGASSCISGRGVGMN